eukprot:4715967-Lingulodinium_polyedra.AAC.1
MVRSPCCGAREPRTLASLSTLWSQGSPWAEFCSAKNMMIGLGYVPFSFSWWMTCQPWPILVE